MKHYTFSLTRMSLQDCVRYCNCYRGNILSVLQNVFSNFDIRFQLTDFAFSNVSSISSSSLSIVLRFPTLPNVSDLVDFVFGVCKLSIVGFVRERVSSDTRVFDD